MNRLNFVRDGESKLPPGFRFQPTDEEIVFQYLSRKTFSHPLPAKIIPEINVFTCDPWELPGDSDQEKYFFCNKLGANNGYGSDDQTTCSGFWKATGFTKRIVCSNRMPIVGIRRCLVFYKGGKNCRAVRTDWIMHEYCIALLPNADSHRTVNSQGSLIRIGDWILCHIFLNKRNATREVDDDDEEDDDDTRWTYDFSTAELSQTDSSSASSSSSPHSDSSIFNEVCSS